MGIVHWLKRVLESKRPRLSSPSSAAPPSTPLEPLEAFETAEATSPESLLEPPPSVPVEPVQEPQSTAMQTVVLTEPAPSVRSSLSPDSQPAPPSRATWISVDKTVQVGSYCLPGLVYVGDNLKGISSHVSTEPALIRPHLKLDEVKPDRQGHWISEWPSYSELPSASRAAYLEWLAEGRRNPQIPLGYVYLFFYGLERRVLRDLRRAKRPIMGELRTIMAEVESLKNVYGDQATFGQETHQFLEICRLLVPQEIITLPPPWTFDAGEVPLSVEVGLGTLAATQTPLPADWAISWAMHVLPSKLRTPASRCFLEWRSWVTHEYHQTFGDGIMLEPDPIQTLPLRTITYQPTSVSFGGPIQLDLPILPKIVHSQGTLDRILPLLEAGMQALDPYSRWLGRNPDRQGSYSALLMLPSELMEVCASPQVKAFRAWVDHRLSAQDRVVVSGQDLLQQWQDPSPDKLMKSEAVVLSDYLARLGIGIEPDVQWGGKPPTAHQCYVLFRLGETALTEPSQKYKLATVLLHLAVMVVLADGDVTEAESQRLQNYLASTPHLQDGERVRLHAHLQGLLVDQLSLRGLKGKVQSITADRKLAIAKFLIHLAAVDGEINPPEIAILSKLYPVLGLEAQTVYRHIHDITVNSHASVASSATPNPDASAQTLQDQLELDRALIDAKVTESATVSALLAEVFVEDDLPDETVEPEHLPGIAGLDQAHSQLVQHLSQQSEWQRQDLEPLVTQLGLMLDGALEIINEAAFEHCDEPLTEGDDPLEINAAVLQDLMMDT